MSFLHLDINLRCSKILFVLLSALHVLAASVLLVIQIWLWIKIVIFLLIAFSWYRICWRILLFKAPHSISRIVFSRGNWRIQNCAGISREACLLGKSYLSAWLVILHFCDVETRVHHSIVLARDSIDRRTFRRLRVILSTAF